MITKVAFIGHPTRDVKATVKFYEEVLGLKKVAEYGEFWLEFETAAGDTIALDTITPKQSDSPSVYMALETDDIEAEMRRMEENGVTKLHDTFENKDDEGQPICKMAIIADPNGNTIVLHEIAARRRDGGESP